MILTRSELIAKLQTAGIPTATVQYLAMDEIAGLKFGTVSMGFMQRAWASYIDLLRSDPNANLTMPRAIGRSGMTTIVPRYIDPGFVCRHAAFSFMGFLLLCCAKQAAASRQENDGYAFTLIYYTANPRAENGNRSGRHSRIVFINDAGDVEEFEEGDGDPEPMTAEELLTVTFMVFL